MRIGRVAFKTNWITLYGQEFTPTLIPVPNPRAKESQSPLRVRKRYQTFLARRRREKFQRALVAWTCAAD